MALSIEFYSTFDDKPRPADVEPEFEGMYRYDFKTLMVVRHNNEIISMKWDGGEPEDQSFGRDWNWVAPLLEKVYKLGKIDG